MIALALGAWIRLTIAVAHGDAASEISSSATATRALDDTVTVHASKAAAGGGKSTKSTVKKATTAKHSSARKTSHQAPAPSSPPSGPQQIAQSRLSSYGWNGGQWIYLDQLWQRESGWNSTATNPTSGAYGIAQALPATQMNSVSSNWKTDASTQIKWGMNYIKDRYGNPQAAWAHEESNGWY